jgi:NAD-dependent deacetylase
MLLVVGTSLVVYPAAGLVNFVHPESPKFVIDPKLPEVSHMPGVIGIEEKASRGMEIFFQEHIFIDLPYE